MTLRGKFIAFEGGDAAGKSTQAQLFAAKIGGLLTREPGGTKLGEMIRTLLLSLDDNVPLISRAELFLFAAARAQHVQEVIEPALEQGIDVVCDRYSASTLSYQGFGRKLPMDDVVEVVKLASCGIEPDVYVLLDITLETAKARKILPPDRIEDEDDAFYGRVLEGFRRLANDDPGSWVTIDADGDIQEIADEIERLVFPRIGR